MGKVQPAHIHKSFIGFGMAPTQPNLKSQPELQMERSVGEQSFYTVFILVLVKSLFWSMCFTNSLKWDFLGRHTFNCQIQFLYYFILHLGPCISKGLPLLNIAKLGQTSQIWSAQSYMVIMEIVNTTYPIRTN